MLVHKAQCYDYYSIVEIMSLEVVEEFGFEVYNK